MLRKQVIRAPASSPAPTPTPDGIDIAAAATVLVTSEDPNHPVDRAFDGLRVPGRSRWVPGSRASRM
jgi:hypothetical protein